MANPKKRFCQNFQSLAVKLGRKDSDAPVVLPLGRANEFTSPEPTMIGIFFVACCHLLVKKSGLYSPVALGARSQGIPGQRKQRELDRLDGSNALRL
jgi:hypothetical protein